MQAYKLGYASADVVPSFVHFLNNNGAFDALDRAVDNLSRELQAEEKAADDGDEPDASRDVVVYGSAVEALHAVSVRDRGWVGGGEVSVVVDCCFIRQISQVWGVGEGAQCVPVAAASVCPCVAPMHVPLLCAIVAVQALTSRGIAATRILFVQR